MTLITHFWALILRCYGISQHHKTPSQLRTEGFGGREQETQEKKEIGNSGLFIIQTFPLGTNRSYTGNTNRKQRKTAWPTLIQHQFQHQKIEGHTERKNRLICESKGRIKCGELGGLILFHFLLFFPEVAVRVDLTRGSMNWLVVFIFRQTSYSTST